MSSTLKYGTPSRTPVAYRCCTACRRVAQSVVDQVVEQFRDEQRIALDQRRLEREPEIDLVRDRFREPVARRGVADRHQVDDFQRPPVIRRALGLRQREQLVRQMARANGRAVHPLKLGSHVRRRLAAHQQLEMHLETGERSPKLVRGVGKKALLQSARVAQMPEQSIECVDDGSDLAGHPRLVDRPQIAG